MRRIHDFPPLLPDDSRSVRQEIRDRLPGYTPEWVAEREDDAGVALVKVFAEQAALVRRQANRLHQKWGLELLRLAGVSSRPATPAEVSLEVTLADTADRTVRVPAGLRLSVPPAQGGDAVVFETIDDLWATSAVVGALVTQAGSRVAWSTPKELETGRGLLPFDRRPRPGNALWVGLAGNVAPNPEVYVAFDLLSGPDTRAAVTVGGRLAPTDSVQPVLAWSVLGSDGLARVQPSVDSTFGLQQSGVVRLPTPADWPALEHPSGDPSHSRLRWLRVALLYGEPRAQRPVAAVRLNVVRARAIRTIRDEILVEETDPVDPTQRLFLLSTTPVVPGSARLLVDLGATGDPFDTTPAPDGQVTRAAFTEVRSFAESGPTDRHFLLDHASGVVTFGDGRHGAAPPPGFRNVRAERYAAGGGSAGAVGSGASFTVSDTVPFLTAVTNRTAATGGLDAEALEEIDQRGPELVRSRGRAVVVADFAVLAIDAPGAAVARALALPAVDARGSVRPGQVTVVIVPVPRGTHPSHVPDEATLRAVGDHLTSVAPIGTRITAVGPRYVRVTVDALLEVEPGADQSVVTVDVVNAVNHYLSPLNGGEDGTGWSFGEPVRHRRVAALLGRVDGVTSVVRLNLLRNGRRQGPCADVNISTDGLPLAGDHVAITVDPSRTAGSPS